MMSKQMNVPIRTRNNQQVQTDVNLVGLIEDRNIEFQLSHTQTHFLQFVNQSWMSPFSDYYLLSQLNSVIQKLKNGLGNGNQFQTRKIIDQLAAKIHGLLSRQLMVTGKNVAYYDILLEKQKQITKLQLKYGHFQKKITTYIKKIQQLQREIKNLRGTLKIYQNAAQENQIYKKFFRQIKQLTTNSKKITDIDKLLTQKVIPKINQLEVNLTELSKNAGKARSNKQKAAISKYALELDSLNKAKQLSWEDLSNSAAQFFTGLEHLNDDNWIQQRLNLNQAYNELNARHTALISLVNKNVQQLLKKDSNFQNITQVKQFIQALQHESKSGYETIIANGWIGLGVIHCHRSHENQNQIQKMNSLILLFQSQIKKLILKYPQLNQTISIQLKQFLSTEITREITGGDALTWIKQIMVRDTQVIHVDNVYNYYSKTDKQDLYYLRILVRSLLDELKRITNDHKVDIQLDESILQILKTQVLDGVNIEDVISLFRPVARICQVPIIVQKPTYIINTQTVGVPLKQQSAFVVSDTTHFAVNLQKGVSYRKEIPYEYATTQAIQIPTTIQKPYSVPTKVIEEVIKFDEKINVIKIPIQSQKFIQVIQDSTIQAKQQILSTQTIIKQIQRPYHTIETQTKQIIVQKQIPKNTCKQLSKIIKVQQTIPVVYKQQKYQIIQKPIHHIIMQKQIQFIKVQKPIIQRLQVPKITQVIIQKPIYYPQHCDCQKPQPVLIQIQKPIYKQLPKQIIIEKCHYIQPNIQQKIVQIPCHSQVPIYKQIIKQQPIFIQKILPLRTLEQKLIVVDRQIPFFIQHFTPVQLIIEKPVIVRDIKHIPIQVQQPIPIYIQKIIPKVIQVFRDKIIQKIVEVPRVQIIQKIVQKIVTIPRIIQKIVTVPQIIEVPVFIDTPVLQVVQIPVQKLVHDIHQVQKIVQVKCQVLKIQKILEKVQKIQYEQVKKIIQVQPQNIPQILVDKIVKVVQEHPVQVYIDRFVDRVIQIKQVVPVEQRVQVPIQVQIPVQIITNKPIFYKQPVVQLDIQRVQRDKIVQLQVQTIKLQVIQTPIIKIQKQIIQIPSQQIILKQPQLHIIQIQKQHVINTRDIEEISINHYLDIDKPHLVQQQTFVIPEKQALFLQKPYAVSIAKPLKMVHQQMVVVQKPETIIVKTRQGKSQQVVKTITQQKLVVQKIQTSTPISIPQHHYHVLYQQLPPKQLQKQIIAIDEKIKTQEITNTVQIQGISKQILTKEIEIPVYLQKIVQKIIMLPQIVQIQKKVYMVQEINSLIAKQVNLQTHYEQYRNIVTDIKNQINQTISTINSNKQSNTTQLKNKLQKLLSLFRTQSRIPKIVQNIRQIEIIKQKDRPVLVPVYDSQRQKVLHLIISELIQGIKGLNKVQVQNRFSQRIRNLFSSQFGLTTTKQSKTVIKQYVKQSQVIQVSSKWKSWLDNYDNNLPSTIPIEHLSQSQQIFMQGYDSKQLNSSTLKASLQKSILINKQRLYEIQQLKINYTNLIDQLRLRNKNLQTLVMTQKYYKDLYYSQLIKLQQMLKKEQFDKVKSSIKRISIIKQQIISTHIIPTTDIKQLTLQISQQQIKDTKLIEQLSLYQIQNTNIRKQCQNLYQQNIRLKKQLDQIQLNIPVWNKQSENQQFIQYNKQWEQKINYIQQNHLFQLNNLRQSFSKKFKDSSSEGIDQLTQSYDQLMNKYNQLLSTQKKEELQKKNIIRNLQNQLKNSQIEHKKIITDYQKRLTSSATNQQKQLIQQLNDLKKAFSNAQQKAEVEKRKLINEYENKLKISGKPQQKQLRNQLDKINKDFEQFQRNSAIEKANITDEFQRKIKILEDQLQKLKSPQKRQTASRITFQQKQNQQLKQKIKKLQQQLQTTKQFYQIQYKSKAGPSTTFTSIVRQTESSKTFKSPQGRYRSSQSKFEQQSQGKELYQSHSGSRKIISKQQITPQSRKQQQQIQSHSSRMSGKVQSKLKISMTLRYLMNLQKTEQKDQVINSIIFKIIDKAQDDQKKGINNCYNPTNVFIKNFNINYLNGLIVNFGAPITNKNNKNDALYLSPQFLNGQGLSSKSIVFWIGVIWDELLHYQSFFKTVDNIVNPTYQYHVRDQSLDPEIRNLLSDMLCKDPVKRLQFAEIKNRIASQREILTESQKLTSPQPKRR